MASKQSPPERFARRSRGGAGAIVDKRNANETAADVEDSLKDDRIKRRGDMRSLISAALFAALSVGITAMAGQPNTALSKAEMQQLLKTGMQIKVRDINGGKEYTGEIKINADGTQSGSVTMVGKDPMALTGNWKLSGSRFCRTLNPIAPKETCEIWLWSKENEVIVQIGGKRIGYNTW